MGLSTLILTGGMVLGGWTNFHFFPSIEADFMAASLTMPQGTPVESTSQAVEKLEEGAVRLRARLRQETGMDYFRHVSAAVGDQPMMSRGGGPMGPMEVASAANLGEVTVELAPAETRAYTSEQLGLMWREATDPIPEAVEVNFDMSLMTPGDDVDVQLAGPDIEQLRAAADEVKRRLTAYAGVYEISDSFRAGKVEMQLGIKPAAETLGLTLQDLGRQVRQAFYGEEAQRIQRGRDDIRVMVRYPRDDRRSLGDLENMRIRTPTGGEVPFSQVALVEPGRGFASIKRVDRNRAVNVTASVDPAITSAGAVIADLEARILPDVLADYSGVFYTFEGAQAEQVEAVGGLQLGFLLAVLMIFALLAVPLRSYVQPLIIMAAIPFGLVGAIWGHMVLGLDVTMMSMFGLVALTGVVVNDSLVMVDFINRARKVHEGRGQQGAPGGRTAAGRPRLRVGGPPARDPRGGGQPVPTHPAHVADHVLRARAADAGAEHAGGVPRADGGVAGLRGAVRDVHHADPGADVVPHPRRCPADAAAAVRAGRAGVRPRGAAPDRRRGGGRRPGGQDRRGSAVHGNGGVLKDGVADVGFADGAATAA